MGRPTVLSEQAKFELSKTLLDMEAKLFGLSPIDVRRIVYKFCVKNGIQNTFNSDTKTAG